MSDDDTILSHAEALTEIHRLRCRVAELEATLATLTGGLSALEPPQAFRIEEVPPSTPR